MRSQRKELVSAISPGYLAAVGVPLLAGRDLSEFDRDQNAIVISAAAARSLWPEDADPRTAVGRALNVNGGRSNIVGVAGDARASLTAPAPPVVYVQSGDSYSGSLVVRSFLPAEALAGPLRQAIGKLAPAAPISRLQALDRLEVAAVAPQRYQLTLLLLFAGLALFLAALGVYAQVAHSVARRNKELAIRISLGAGVGTIWGTVMRQALGPPVVGLAAGLLAAVFASPLLSSLLFQVNPVNAAVLLAVARGWRLERNGRRLEVESRQDALTNPTVRRSFREDACAELDALARFPIHHQRRFRLRLHRRPRRIQEKTYHTPMSFPITRRRKNRWRQLRQR